jgi:hypothetical protein
MDGGVISACGIGSGAIVGTSLGAFFFSTFAFRLTVRFAFFFAPFLALRFAAKH